MKIKKIIKKNVICWILMFSCVVSLCACSSKKTVDNNDSKKEDTWYVYNGAKLNMVYAEKFSDNIQEAAVIIIEGVENADEQIDFKDLDINEGAVNTALNIAMISNPLCYSVTLTKKEGNIYTINYDCSIEEQKTRVENFKTKINIVITENIKQDYTDEEKVNAIYTYLATNMFYDDQIYNKYSLELGMYKSFVESQGVCLHFAYSLQFYLNQLGIDSIICSDAGAAEPDKVIQSSGAGLFHTWNMVKLDDNWYHFDVTYENNVYEFNKGTASDAKLEYQFYGMSDSTRAITRDSFNRTVYGPINPTNQLVLPVCETDLND